MEGDLPVAFEGACLEILAATGALAQRVHTGAGGAIEGGAWGMEAYAREGTHKMEAARWRASGRGGSTVYRIRRLDRSSPNMSLLISCVLKGTLM
jgi:hypothetical protein